MKKLFTILMAIFMIFSMLSPNIVAFADDDDDYEYDLSSPEVVEEYRETQALRREYLQQIRIIRSRLAIRYSTLDLVPIFQELEAAERGLPETEDWFRYYTDEQLLQMIEEITAWINDVRVAIDNLVEIPLPRPRPSSLPQEPESFSWDDWTQAGLITAENLRYGPGAVYVATPMSLTAGREPGDMNIGAHDLVFVYDAYVVNGYVFVMVIRMQDGWDLSPLALWIPVADLDFENIPEPPIVPEVPTEPETTVPETTDPELPTIPSPERPIRPPSRPPGITPPPGGTVPPALPPTPTTPPSTPDDCISNCDCPTGCDCPAVTLPSTPSSSTPPAPGAPGTGGGNNNLPQTGTVAINAGIAGIATSALGAVVAFTKKNKK